MILQGLANFPGVWQVQSCEVAFSHGISPSVFRLSIAPQMNWPAIGGTLTLTFGRVKILIYDCRVNSASVVRNQGGQIVSLEIFDRRWKWQDDMGTISGHYNVRGANNEILRRIPGSANAIDDSERTPQQLARLCLDAMGERGYDVSGLPNQSRPQVDWEVESPARSLENLCEVLGCHVVLGLLSNRVNLCRVGVGKRLPTMDMVDWSGAIDPPERPDELIVVGGPNRYEADLRLEAIGKDLDGKIKLIASLSYRPDTTDPFYGGWDKIDLATFEAAADEKTRTLAHDTVYRWFRIIDAQVIPGFGRIDTRELILPIEDEQVTYTMQDKVKKNKPAQVFGVWYREDKDYDQVTATALVPMSASESDKTIIPESWFSIDTTLGIVKFDKPIYTYKGTFPNWTKDEPKLILRTACSVRDKKTRAWVRYERSRKNRGRKFGTKAKRLLHEEIVLCHYPTYGATYGPTDRPYRTITTNKTFIEDEADYVLNAAEQQYQTKMPESARYAGLIPIELDGAIQSVTYSITGQGTFTVIQRNQDPPTVANVSYQEKRRMEKAREASEKAARERIRTTKRSIEMASVK